MTVQQLALIFGIFSAAVIFVTLAGFFFFVRWSKRESRRRGGQIAMARLDPDEFAEIKRDQP